METLYRTAGTQVAFPPPVSTLNMQGGTQGMPSIHRVARQFLFSTYAGFLMQGAICASQPETAHAYNIKPIATEQRLDLGRTDIQMLARIRQLGTYHDGWDGANGKAPSHAAVMNAEYFTRVLVHHDIYTPYISLASDGEINFLWMLPHFRLDLGFYGDNTYSYYGETSTRDEFLVDEAFIFEPLPEPVLQLIRKK